jgi:hypothetical protein
MAAQRPLVRLFDSTRVVDIRDDSERRAREEPQ